MVLTIKKTRTMKGRTSEVMEVVEKPIFLADDMVIIEKKMDTKSKTKTKKESE